MQTFSRHISIMSAAAGSQPPRKPWLPGPVSEMTYAKKDMEDSVSELNDEMKKVLKRQKHTKRRNKSRARRSLSQRGPEGLQLDQAERMAKWRANVNKEALERQALPHKAVPWKSSLRPLLKPEEMRKVFQGPVPIPQGNQILFGQVKTAFRKTFVRRCICTPRTEADSVTPPGEKTPVASLTGWELTDDEKRALKRM